MASELSMHKPLVLEIEQYEQRVELPPGRGHVVGRLAGADVVVPHPSVGSRHVLFSDEEGIWTVEDLGSPCGIAINEQRKASHDRCRSSSATA
jgi:pSer/pThr/pTyr-binding forkhead associated (FHA) protein